MAGFSRGQVLSPRQCARHQPVPPYCLLYRRWPPPCTSSTSWRCVRGTRRTRTRRTQWAAARSRCAHPGPRKGRGLPAVARLVAGPVHVAAPPASCLVSAARTATLLLRASFCACKRGVVLAARLQVENVECAPPNHIKFDFLGKDSIRYENTVDVSWRGRGRCGTGLWALRSSRPDCCIPGVQSRSMWAAGPWGRLRWGLLGELPPCLLAEPSTTLPAFVLPFFLPAGGR